MENYVPLVALCFSFIGAIGTSGLTPEEISSTVATKYALYEPNTSLLEYLEEPTTPCGELVDVEIWGPVTNATTYDSNCDTQTEQVYRAHNHFKKKRIYEHGVVWICYDTTATICHSYFRQECPGTTCLLTSPDE
ncbi:MAG: hypothetical protein ACKVQS_05535 [Fimbriimonadaceae bacterium]